MRRQLKTSQITMLGLMIAVLLLMAYTPLGYLNIGPLAITFNVIPVAISAIVLGPVGGAIAGAVFGITSFLQCLGIGGTSLMGAELLLVNPLFAFIQRFVPRFLDGLLLGYIFRGIRGKAKNIYLASAVTGFFSAFLNTLFFMTFLVVLFGNCEYVQNLRGGSNVIVFICSFVGVNAVCEMISSTLITGIIGAALYKAGLLAGKQGGCDIKPEGL